jgi:hypothetical protein
LLAVEAVIGEPVSTNEFPVSRENTGNSSGSKSDRAILLPICLYFASDLDQIPHVQEQGIFARKHGTSTREQGGDPAAAGNDSDLLAGSNRGPATTEN